MNPLLRYCGEVATCTVLWHLLHLALRSALHATISLRRTNTDRRHPSPPAPETIAATSARSTLGTPSLSSQRRKGVDTDFNNRNETINKSNNNSGENDDDVEDDNVRLKIRTKLRRQGASYLVSTIHAVVQTARGLNHLFTLFRAPITLKLYHPSNDLYPGHLASLLSTTTLGSSTKYLRENDAILASNLLLTSYLLSDLIFVLLNYPSLGRMDVVLHHTAFLYCSVIGGYYQMNTFMFTWLIIGEASTPLLNLRWLLLTLTTKSKTKSKTSSRSLSLTSTPRSTASVLLTVTQALFALLFFVTRVCVYSLGLYYQFEIIADFPAHLPKWAIFSTLVFVIAGFLLNLFWFFKIAGKFFGRGRGRSRTNTIRKRPRVVLVQPADEQATLTTASATSWIK